MSAPVGRTLTGMTDAELRQAAAILRRLIADVDEGRIEAGGPTGAALARRLQGAATALEAASQRETTPHSEPERRVLRTVEKMLVFGKDHRPAEYPHGVSSLIVAALFERTIRTAEGVVYLCGGGFAAHGDMLNRTMFEDMITAHWVTLNRDLALERLQQHERFQILLWHDVAAGHPELFGEIPPSEHEADRQTLQGTFGRYGHRHWTGLGVHSLVEACEGLWIDERGRRELWQYYRVAHRFNSSQIHSGSYPLARTALAITGEVDGVDIGFHGPRTIIRPLGAASWIFAQMLGLLAEEFGRPAANEVSTLLGESSEIFNMAIEETKVGE